MDFYSLYDRYIRREVYLAVMMDRASNGPVIVGSAVGGMNIETIAKETPDAIIKVISKFPIS